MSQAPASQQDDGYTIAVQPICNAQMAHVADELLYRLTPDCQSAVIRDATEATARACAVAFYEVGIEKLNTDRQLFINASREWLLNPDLAPLPPYRVVIEILEDVVASPEVLKAARHFRQRGYRIALDDFVLGEENAELIEVADIVKVDITQPPSAQALELLQRSGVILLAERVETHQDFDTYRELGFSLFQGYFFSRPKVLQDHRPKRSANQGARLKLLAYVFRDDFQVREVAELLSQDPYLVAAVFKRANSPAFHTSECARNLIQCINLLGMREIRTLITILVLARNGPVCQLALLQALTRAFMCEQLARHVSGLDPTEGFTIGLFSMMAPMLGMPLSEVLQEIPLAETAKAALLHGEGRWGSVLRVVTAHETGNPLSRSRFSRSQVNDCHLEAATRARTLLDAVARS